MGKIRKIAAAFLVVAVAISSFASCSSVYDSKKDIVVLYTNDVHCEIDKNLGYAGLAQYKKQMLVETPNVILVDAGDAIQGGSVGTVSRGEYIVDIMNKVGYDYAVLGNHEFDYTIPRLAELIAKSNAKYLSSNITYTGTGKNLLSGTKKYDIVNFNGKKVAFIGVSTPKSITTSTPAYFMEKNAAGKDVIVYDFASGKDLYEKVQDIVDEVRLKGANHVVVIAHLGGEDDCKPDRSRDLIENISGVDAVIDGHSHTTMAGEIVMDKTKKPVVLTQTGSKLGNIGKLTITPDGKVSSELIKNVEKDPEVSAFIDSVKAKFEGALKAVVAKSEIDLLTTTPEGFRAVRNRETAIGDFCADAYRAVSGADIAFANGGGIRADIKKGDLTTSDMINVQPYGNNLCLVECSGQDVLDALELGAKSVTPMSNDGSKALGEFGGFLQVSGLKYTIDTNVPSTVECDSKGFFTGVSGARRVKDVKVLKGGKWSVINPEAKYTVVSHNYKIKNKGDGYTMFADKPMLLDEFMLDNQAIITYIVDYLGGTIPAGKYSKPDGRISVL